MKVKELIERLKEANPEDIVVTSIDPEGNGYFPIGTVDTEDSVYAVDEHEIYLRYLTPDLERQGYDEDDVRDADGEEFIAAVVIWPR